jgi:hypothetical protein
MRLLHVHRNWECESDDSSMCTGTGNVNQTTAPCAPSHRGRWLAVSSTRRPTCACSRCSSLGAAPPGQGHAGAASNPPFASARCGGSCGCRPKEPAALVKSKHLDFTMHQIISCFNFSRFLELRTRHNIYVDT